MISAPHSGLECGAFMCVGVSQKYSYKYIDNMV